MFIHLAEKNTSPGRNHMLFLFTASSSECDNTMSVIRCWLCHTYLIGSNIVIKILYFTIWIRGDFTRLIKILESLWVANNDNNNKSLLYLKQEYMRKDIWIQAQKYEMVLLQLWAHMRVAPGSPAGSSLATNGSQHPSSCPTFVAPFLHCFIHTTAWLAHELPAAAPLTDSTHPCSTLHSWEQIFRKVPWAPCLLHAEAMKTEFWKLRAGCCPQNQEVGGDYNQ